LATTASVAAGAKAETDQPFLDLIHQGRYDDLVSSYFKKSVYFF
jgi:hypothetical protein